MVPKGAWIFICVALFSSCHAASSKVFGEVYPGKVADGGRQVQEDPIGCSGFTLGHCEVPEGSVLASVTGIDATECQMLCNMTYRYDCNFFLHNQDSQTCQLISEPLPHYIDSCSVIGGPPSPLIGTCLTSSDPCKEYLQTMCDYGGRVLMTLPQVASVERCQETCHNLQCKLFQFNRPNATCTLYQSVTKSCHGMAMPPTPDLSMCISPPSTTTLSTTTVTTPKTTTHSPSTTTVSTSTTPQPSSKSFKLLAISGYDDKGQSTSVEYIGPSKNSHLYCVVPDYPVPMDVGTAQNFGNNFIVSCGDCDRKNRQCYSYNATEGWKEYAQLAEYRQYTASVLINDHEMWVLGGYNTFEQLKTTEIISTKTKSARKGPDLPVTMYRHCAVKVNATHVFIGDGDMKFAYMVNVSQQPFEFTSLPGMKYLRNDAGCGFIMMKNGVEGGVASEVNEEPAVIVAGGSPSPSTSEIFLLEKNQWMEGPALPRGFKYGGSVNPDEQTLIFAGGEDEHGNRRSDIFKLDVVTMKFVSLPGKLKPRSKFAMTWMMDDEQC